MITIVYLLLACTVSPILNGFVISTLWGWFVVPVFGAPSLSVPYASGLFLVVAYMSMGASFYKNMELDIDKYLVHIFVKPLAAIIFGFIVKQFI